mgnify:CR=1 FL=1
MKRRDFIRQTATGLALAGLSPALLRSCASSHDPLRDFGIISGVVKKELEANPEETLYKLSEMGYRKLEFGGTFGMDPSDLLSLLEKLKLQPVAGGTSMASLQGDGLKKAIDDQLQMNKKYLICYWPWMHSGKTIDQSDLDFTLEHFERIGKTCNDNGLRFAFHNHEKEFQRVGDHVIYDYFLEMTDPELVTMELDLYWAIIGGANPVDYINRYPDRFEILHVKDSYDPSRRDSFACVGEGVIDFNEILQLRDTGGFKHLIVEKDGAENGLACAETSINYLRSLNF